MNRLQGKVALIIGAGSVGDGWGNGRGCAVLFASEAATVAAADIDQCALNSTLDLIEPEQGDATGYRCDVTDDQSVSALIEKVEADHGRIDILVNIVGGSRAGGAAEMTPEVWNDQLNFNLTSVYRTCHGVLPGMIERESGSIVNIASTSGIRYTGSPQVAYASTKAGVISFSRVTAVQYAKHGIRVNTVVPGQLHTPMVESRLAGQRAGGDVGKLLQQRRSSDLEEHTSELQSQG